MAPPPWFSLPASAVCGVAMFVAAALGAEEFPAAALADALPFTARLQPPKVSSAAAAARIAIAFIPSPLHAFGKSEHNPHFRRVEGWKGAARSAPRDMRPGVRAAFRK